MIESFPKQFLAAVYTINFSKEKEEAKPVRKLLQQRRRIERWSDCDFERCLGRKNHKTWAMGGCDGAERLLTWRSGRLVMLLTGAKNVGQGEGNVFCRGHSQSHGCEDVQVELLV